MKSHGYSRRVQAHALQGGPPPVPADVRTLYLALHSEDPGAGDSQAAVEVPGVTRAAVPRSPSSWLQDGDSFVNNVLVSFAKIGTHPTTRRATHWSLGQAATGAGAVIVSGKLKDPQEIVAGMILEFPPGTIRHEEF